MGYEISHTQEEIKATVEGGLMLYDDISLEQLDYLDSKDLVYEHQLDGKLQHFFDNLPNDSKSHNVYCRRLDYKLSKEIKDYIANRIQSRLEFELNQYASVLSNKLDVYAINDDEKVNYLKGEKKEMFSRFNNLDFTTNSPTELVEFYLSDNIIFDDINAFIIDDNSLKMQFWLRLSKLDWVRDSLECNLMKMQMKHLNSLLTDVDKPLLSTSVNKSTTQQISFNDLFKNEKDKEFILDALEELAITRNGKSILSDRKKSSLRGFVEALKEEAIIPNHNTDTLCELFAKQIDMPYNARLKDTDTSVKTKKALKSHIVKYR